MAGQGGRWLPILILLVLLAGCGPGVGSGGLKGQEAPDFALQDLAGKEVRLNDFRGRPVVLHFWTTWCPSCRVEMPELQKAQASLGSDRVRILAVDLAFQDDRAEVQRMVNDLGLTIPVLLDEVGTVSLADFRVSTLPTSFFIDAQGRIFYVQVGPMTAALMERVLQQMGE